MICEETPIAEKVTKLFPHENIVLNKKYNLIIEVDEGNHANYD